MGRLFQRNILIRRMAKRLRIVLPIIVLASAIAMMNISCSPDTTPDSSSSKTSTSSASNNPFPDFGFLPTPIQYTGMVFKLSQDYPETAPTGPMPAFFDKLPAQPWSNDFEKGGWNAYMMAVRDYCFEGNTSIDFRVENNTVRQWYHMPWQHAGPAGREGVHGLTKEAQVMIGQLGSTQNASGQTYAVGFFNEHAGYTLGRVWADHNDPDPRVTSAPDGGTGFAEGATIFKLLFVDVDPTTVPGLGNPMQWEAYITETYDGQSRAFKMVSVIQMDIAIKDSRAPNGWLFGTFQYNGKVTGKPAWENLIPVGIMWGNDPGVTSDSVTQFRKAGLSATKPPAPLLTQTRINLSLTETAINANAEQLPPSHLGWNGRLNGPVDNYQSSCMSCHMTAEVPALSPANPTFQAPAAAPPIGSPVNQPPPAGFTGDWYGGWMRWFQNVQCGVPFDAEGNQWTQVGATSTDFSLQLSQAIGNFQQWKAYEGLYATNYKGSPGATEQRKSSDTASSVEPGASDLNNEKIPSAQGRAIHPVTRDKNAPK